VLMDSFNLLMIPKNGDIWHLRLESEGRSISSFGLDRVGMTVSPSNVCHFLDKYIFIASQVGDSVLIEYDYSVLKTTGEELGEEEMDLDLYGTTTESAFKISTDKSLHFTVHDSLLCIGPIHDFAIGDANSVVNLF
jgi:hypothetical protein